MATADSVNQFIANTESIRGQAYDPEEVAEIHLWNKGRALAQLVNLYGWEVLLEMLQSYVDDATEQLLKTDPSNKEEVLSSQAVAFAANRIRTALIQDVQQAVDASRRTPVTLKQVARGIPAESLNI